MKAILRQIESQTTPLRATLAFPSGRYFYAHYEFTVKCGGCGEHHTIMLVQPMSVN